MVRRLVNVNTSTTPPVTATATHEPIHVIVSIVALSAGLRWPTTHLVTWRSKSVTAWVCTTICPRPNSATVMAIHPSDQEAGAGHELPRRQRIRRHGANLSGTADKEQ